jgi:hypothetical protein
LKIHVVLRKGWNEDSVAEVIRVGRMTQVNEARARRYGIVSGEAPPTAPEALRALAQVESVEADEVKRILQG